MSNILIIKHGSLGDIVQASGAIKDISEKSNSNSLLLPICFSKYLCSIDISFVHPIINFLLAGCLSIFSWWYSLVFKFPLSDLGAPYNSGLISIETEYALSLLFEK